MAYNVTSQWDDIHRKLGNYSELPVEKEQAEYTKEAIEKLEGYDAMADKDLDELEDMEDDFDDDFLEQYKAKKLAELKQQSAKPQFGYVREITRQDYIDHVNEAPKDVFVVLHLYHTYIEVCNLINQVLDDVAVVHKDLKILKIVADKCIENYPEKNVPTLIVYKNGKMFKTIPRFDKLYRKITVASFQDLLGKHGIIPVKDTADRDEANELKSYAFGARKRKQRRDSFSSDEEDRDDRGFTTSKMGFKYI